MKRTISISIFALSLMLAGCGGTESSESSAALTGPPCCKAMPGANEIPNSIQIMGNTAIATSREFVIRDQAQWASFWAESNADASRAPPPVVDFSTAMLVGVVVASLNDCYFVYPRTMVWQPDASAPDHVEVRYAVQPPGDGCVVHETGISRIFVSQMARSALPVAFVKVD